MQDRLLKLHTLADNLTVVVPEAQVPMTGPFDTRSWAWLNLVLAGLSLVALLVLAAAMLIRHSRQGQPDGRLLSTALPWLMPSALASVLLFFLFAFSQDLQGTMLGYDRFSPVLFFLLAVQSACMGMALRRSGQAPQRSWAGGAGDATVRTSKAMGGRSRSGDSDNLAGQSRLAKRRLLLRSGESGSFEDGGDE